MAENSSIEWTTHTANLWWGCTEVHAGCDNCYARTLANRWNFQVWGNDQPRREIASVWKDLDRFQRKAQAAGQIHSVFVGSMMDIFEKPMPLIKKDGTIDTNANTGNLRFHLFYRIDRGDYPNLRFLFLTKRPGNINKYIFTDWFDNPPPNVMFGTSISDQEHALKLVPQLLQVKGHKFLSVEPLLAPLWLYVGWLVESEASTYQGKIDWVIVGGESGPQKRPFDTEWARMLRDRCAQYKIPFFMKQIDKIQPIPADLMIREFPNFQNTQQNEKIS